MSPLPPDSDSALEESRSESPPHGTPYQAIGDPVTVVRKPLWIRVGLAGVTTRTQARFWLAASTVAGPVLFALSAGLGVRQLKVPYAAAVALGLAIGTLAVPVALWYWLAIRWMDAHRAWQQSR